SNPIGAMLAEGIISGIGWGIGGAAATVGIGKAKKALRKSKVGKKANPSGGGGKFIEGEEDMDWLRDVHLHGLDKKYKFAVLYGNEDWPERIEVYEKNDVNETPLVFTSDDEGNFSRV
ncbi:MAG: hypothetical protein Q7R39_15990, partial [Dehalococcoidia bacterium]|nr:hypothetical protein [Dehalococcoidia bacterium]